MDLKDITPLITAFGPLALFIGMFDWILRDHHKERLFNFFVRSAQLGSKPLSFGFYGFVVVCSAIFTFAILSINGSIGVLTKSAESATWKESSAPILIAVVFKVLVWDYFLALKSFVVGTALRAEITTRKGTRKPAIASIPGAIFVLLDIIVTVMLTRAVLNWWEVKQALHEDAVPQKIADALGFFDSVNFFAKDTIKNAFYILNGSLVMYLAMLLSAAARGTVAHLNVDDIRKNICKIIAGFGVFGVFVVAVSRQLASH